MRERAAFKAIRMKDERAQDVAGHGVFVKYTPKGVWKVYQTAVRKVVKGFELASGMPVDPQVFRCWLEDVYGRTVYREPSHSWPKRKSWRPTLSPL